MIGNTLRHDALENYHAGSYPDFSPETFFASALGVLGGEGNYGVVIRFAATVAERVREREWQESQEMRELPGGALKLRMRLGALMEVEQWVLGWGAAAEVVAPAELRNSIRNTVAALAVRYGAWTAGPEPHDLKLPGIR